MTIQTRDWLTPTVFLARHKGKFGRNTLYNWLAEGKLPHIQIGRKILIPSDAFDRMLAGQAGEQQQEAPLPGAIWADQSFGS